MTASANNPGVVYLEGNPIPIVSLVGPNDTARTAPSSVNGVTRQQIMLANPLTNAPLDLSTLSLASVQGLIGQRADGATIQSDGLAYLDGVVNQLSSKLGRWYRAVAQALDTPVTIDWGGDSTTFGYYSDNVTLNPSDTVADEMSTPGQLRRLCAQYYGARAGFIHSGQSAAVASGGNPLVLGFGLGAFGTAYNASGTVTVTVPACTSITVYCWNDDGSTGGGVVNGSGSFTVNGGSAINTTLIAGTNKYKAVTTTTGLNAASTNTIVWTAPSGSYQGFVGISYDSGKGVNIGRWGRGGNTLADFMGHGANLAFNARTLPWLTAGWTMRTPNLVIIQFNINEAGLPTGTSVSQQTTDLTNIIAAVRAAGGCVLLIGDNQYSAYATGHQADFEAVMQSLADSTADVAYIPFATIIGAYATAFANGLMGESSNAIHPNRKGYGLLARFLMRLLITNPTGPQF